MKQDDNDNEENIDHMSKQLLINYSFGHENSSLLFYPYGINVNYINHNSKSPNATGGAWYNAFALYDGSGNPGGVGNGAGCGNGAVASGSSGSVAITLGTESTTNATNNVVLVRVKLGSSNSISAISVS